MWISLIWGDHWQVQWFSGNILDLFRRLSPLNVFWQSGHWFQWLRTIGQIMQWFWWIVVIYPSKIMFLVQKYNSIIEAFLVLTSPSSCYWVGCWVIMQALWTTFSPWQPCLPPCLSVFPSPKIDIGNKSVCHPLMASAGQLLWKVFKSKNVIRDGDSTASWVSELSN